MEYDPETPLPDSDLSTSGDATDTPPTANDNPPAEPAVKREWSHNDDFTVATLTEGEVGQTFDLSKLPANSIAYLAYRGFTVAGAKDANATFAKLMTGERLGVRGTAATPKVNHWHEAIALAIVDATKKAPSGQKTIEAAREMVTGMSKDKDKIKQMKLDPKVVTHFNKLTGGMVGSSLAAFLSSQSEAA